MDIKLESLKRGFFKHTNKPGLVKEVTLFNYLNYCNSRHRLVKEVAYGLLTKPEERYKPQYKIAYNSCSIGNWEFKIVLSKSKTFKTLNNLLIVDISILDKVIDRKVLFEKYEWFKLDLIKELKSYE
jgi:hypothetical protein